MDSDKSVHNESESSAEDEKSFRGDMSEGREAIHKYLLSKINKVIVVRKPLKKYD